ncbi:MAG: DUF1573 domain-containing protein [Chitinophagaceae bacterium]
MKKVVFALAIALCSSSVVFAQNAAPAPVQKTVDKNAPKFDFLKGEVHDFGNLTDAKDAECTFKFKNTGKTPLIIQTASASCGCTVPEFPKEPVLPGKTGEIKVTFHTAGKSGPFDKTVFIQSNAPSNVSSERYEIHIKGSVTPGAKVNAIENPKG